MSNIAVFGLYNTESQAAQGVDELRLVGFRHTDVSLLYSENGGNKDLAHEKKYQGARGRHRGRQYGRAGRRRSWLARRNRSPGDSRPGALHCSRPHHGTSERTRRRRNGRRPHGRSHRRRNAGIRSQALRRAHPKRGSSPIGAY